MTKSPADRFADHMVSTHQIEQRRRQQGPVCGLCRHSDFTPDEISSVLPGPRSKAVFRVSTCQAISLNSRAMQITATSGKDCHHFQPKRTT